MNKVGVIGLGIMGGAMARHLAAGDGEVIGFDVSPDAMQRFADAGGSPARSVEEVAAKAELIIVSLPTRKSYESVMGSLAASSRSGQLIVDTCTMDVEAKHLAREQLAARGAVLLDCPVSGTGAQAAVKDLVIYASGDRAEFDRALPVLQQFSRRQAFVGRFGNGSTMKLISVLLVNIHNVATAEAMVLAQRAGLDLQEVYDTVADGSGGSRMFQMRGPLMVAGKYDEPTARIDMYMKDLDIISRFAAGLRCPTPLFNAATQLYYSAQQRGLGELDTAAVCLVLEQLAGIDRAAPREGKR